MEYSNTTVQKPTAISHDLADSSSERAVQINANKKARKPFLEKINAVVMAAYDAAQQFVKGLNPDGDTHTVTQYNA